MSSPHAVTTAVVEAELPGALAWADRHGWSLTFVPGQLRLAITTKHPKIGIDLEIVADCPGYRGLPPAWRFVVPGTDDSPKRAFPAPGGPPTSIFHGNGLICAPWNRLAYSDHGGVHAEWGGATTWLGVVGTSRATTIGDMLAVIDLHLGTSPGMMS